MNFPMFRIVKKPDFTFEEWAKQKGITIPQFDIGMAVLGKAGSPTKRTQGLLKTNWNNMKEVEELRKQYLSEVTYTEHEVPLDLSKESDQAYLRVLQKREERKNANI